jgi:RND family efflux transporter MFP subunit
MPMTVGFLRGQRARGGLLVLVVALLGGTGCNNKAAATSEDDQVKGVKVTTTTPKVMTISRQIEQPGYLKAYESTPIYTKISGFVETVRVDIGDSVKKNELLAKLWIPEVVSDLKVKADKIKQAQADLKQAKENANAVEASVKSAKSHVDEAKACVLKCVADVKRWQAEEVRAKKLLKEGIYDVQTYDETVHQVKVSDASEIESRAKKEAADSTLEETHARYSKAKADVEVASAHLDVAKSEYAQFKDWVDYSELRAPFDGKVTLRNVHTGHFLQPSMSGSTSKSAEPLFCVMRCDIMRVTIQVPEKDAPLVKDGDAARIRLQALPGRQIEGTVTRSSWSLDERARTLRVEVHVPNPNEVLRPGMYANVVITAKVPHALVLPPQAVMTDGDKSYCAQVENGVVHRIFVEVGIEGDEGIQMLRKQAPNSKGKWEDFTGNEQFVTSNPSTLLDGQHVEFVAAKS